MSSIISHWLNNRSRHQPVLTRILPGASISGPWNEANNRTWLASSQGSKQNKFPDTFAAFPFCIYYGWALPRDALKHSEYFVMYLCHFIINPLGFIFVHFKIQEFEQFLQTIATLNLLNNTVKHVMVVPLNSWSIQCPLQSVFFWIVLISLTPIFILVKTGFLPQFNKMLLPKIV